MGCKSKGIVFFLSFYFPHSFLLLLWATIIDVEVTIGVVPEIPYILTGTSVLIDTPELGADFMVWLCRERRDWLRGCFVSANWDADELLGKCD